VSRKPRDIRLGRFSIGDTALPLAKATGADGFLLLASRSIAPSKGRKALAAILGGGWAPPLTQLVGVLVDGRSGRVDVVMVGQSLGPVLKNPAAVARTVTESMLQRYPRKDEVLKAKRPKGAQAVDEDEPTREDLAEEQVLAEFESLYARRASGEAPPTPAAAVADTAEPSSSEESPSEPTSNEAQPEEPATSEDATTPEVATPAPAPAPPRAVAEPVDASEPVPAPPRARIEDAPDPDARALFEVPAAERPAQSLGFTLLAEPGATALILRNGTDSPVLVSVDVGAFRKLDAGESVKLGVEPGHHRVLVTDAGPRELVRVACKVDGGTTVTVELAPLP
jgi:hypothetical protein